MHSYSVYIMTNKPHGTLYVGITNNLIRRVLEHKNNIVGGFTSRYKLYKLVYYNCTSDVNSAIAYEKKIKKWNRQWKIDLVTKFNKNWDDLYCKLI